MDYVTIPDVEIGSVGMQWRASNGVLSLTMQNLADVARAANDDPHIVSPRLKLGHEGWPEMDGLDCSPFGTTAEPALGRLRNLRLTNDGATLIGDYVDVPAWVPAAYPNRSGEWLGQVEGYVTEGVTTPGGKHYSMVLTAVALLGVSWPAIADIEDLADLEQFLTTGTVNGQPVAISTSTGEDPMPQPIAARADIDTIQRSFWADFATQGSEYWWWWPRDIYTDPNEVLADDDEGHLYRVPFTSNDDGDVTWGDPVRVRVDLVDLPDLEPAAAAQVVAASHRAVIATSATLHRTFATAAAARPAERHTQRAAADVAAVTQAATERPHPDEGDPVMGINIAALRERLGLTEEQLPDGATEEQVNTALAATTEPEASVEELEVEIEAAVEPEPVAASRVVQVDRDQWETTQRNAELGAQAARATATAELDAEADAAVRDGRITPASRDEWRRAIDPGDSPDAAATARATSERQSLAGLAKGRVPVDELRGSAQGADGGTGAITTTGWFPQLKKEA